MSKVRDGILGLCVGDALGVPVEFRSRKELDAAPLADMIGYGSHNQPPGTWSDDSSLTFALMQSVVDCGGVDLYDIASHFTGWLYKLRWTPHGRVFDVGNATAMAIERLNDELIRPDLAGGRSENSNGNGSLMRILPLAYLLQGADLEERMTRVRQVSSITHGHDVSVIGCSIYVEIAIRLLNGRALQDAIAGAIGTINEAYGGNPELRRYDRILQGGLEDIAREDIQSGGYVVHTLEAALWCLLRASSYEEAVLLAINLGDDTDTTGAVAGGLAGIIYGASSIPAHWIAGLARLGDIEALCDRFESACGANGQTD
ncbi:ADP-ribosylglycohydrolase family protein [Paenibacillus methanolicus]|uniref:ADP-ribosylglycohydrolase n=1 Tax=Paenibacillus methanolicus TaxID=582686 RepID=A0A5S5C1J7_9BACL|nr:ADP-ribosylglycohydrolase family protein [Paenibacillus methanolicus]TYP72478.1 ADP-ribosylglycohydrolase [Paenibacillus methanolicus]